MSAIRTIILIAIVKAVYVNADDKVDLKMLSLEACETNDDIEPYEFDIEIDPVDDDSGYLKASATVTLREDLTENFDFTMLIEKWADGSWQEQSTVEGKIWDYVQKVGSRTYRKLAKITEPNLPDFIPVKAGTYKFENYEIEFDDLDLPAMLFGRFKLTLRVYSPEGEIGCKAIEVETKKKE